MLPALCPDVSTIPALPPSGWRGAPVSVSTMTRPNPLRRLWTRLSPPLLCHATAAYAAVHDTTAGMLGEVTEIQGVSRRATGVRGLGAARGVSHG